MRRGEPDTEGLAVAALKSCRCSITTSVFKERTQTTKRPTIPNANSVVILTVSFPRTLQTAHVTGISEPEARSKSIPQRL